MDEQKEAKCFHTAQVFTNAAFQFTMKAHGALREKTGREAADSFYDALIHSIELARRLGRDETGLISKQAPFSTLEAEILTIHAAIYAFSQFSPIPQTDMKAMMDGAMHVAQDLIEDRKQKGLTEPIDPVFSVRKGEGEEVIIGVSLREEDPSN